MKQVLFASSNKAKVDQFQYVADMLGHPAKIVSVYELYPQIRVYDEEYQTQYEIVERGALEIYDQVKQPIVVEDTILEVEALSGGPGLHANDYLKQRGRLGLVEELGEQSNRQALITSIVGFYDGRQLLMSKTVIRGTIGFEESWKDGEPAWVGPAFHPFGGGFNAVFVLDATGRTLADHSAQEGLRYGYREPNFAILLQLLG
jgi:non-canonical purine NTP pyrophosphatase (RdgB/HAM1 family)